MSIRIFVVSNDVTDYEARLVRGVVRNRRPDFYVLPCDGVHDLVKQIGTIVVETRQKIDLLDFHGHGAPGKQCLGNDTLFDHTGVGIPLAQKLSVFLAAYARVRLLGCCTAMWPEGAKLLRLLRCSFGQSIVVQGTILELDSGRDYDENGFMQQKEETRLFSTTDLDGGVLEAPNQDRRNAERREWMNRVREVMGSHT